jgi:hypothetical protein
MSIAIERAFGKARAVLKILEKSVREAGVQGQRTDQVEREIFDCLLQMGHSLMEAYFTQAGSGNIGPTVERNGEQLQRLEGKQTRTYVSIFGPVSVSRYVYAIRRGQKGYAPLDEKLALPELDQSYVLEDWLQRFCVQNAFGESVQSLRELLGTKTSKRTAERINQELASYVQPFRQSRSTEFSDEQEVLVATADEKGITMRSTLEARHGLPELPWRRFHQKKQDAKADERATKRLGKGQVKNRKQMACVGAVYSIQSWKRTADDVLNELTKKPEQPQPQQRPRPQNKHVQATLTNYEDGERREGQPAVFASLAAQVEQRDPERKKPLVCLMDGQRSLWNMQRKYLPRATCIVDIFHVIERVWSIAYLFHKEGSLVAEQMVNHYLKMMLEGKVSYAIGSLRRKSTELSKAKRETLEKALAYFQNNRDYMQYDKYLEQGYPIGSGVVEGACRHLVKDRMERTGMRWEVQGAQAMLDTRSAYINNEWEDLIEYRIQQEQLRIYGQAA